MLIWEIERRSVVPRLSDLEPDGRRSWPWEPSRPPWFALEVAVQSGPGLVGKGERGAGLMSAGDVDELSIILRPRKRWGPHKELSGPASTQTTRRDLFASGKYRGATKCPWGRK